MLNVPQEIKDLLHTDSVKKNIRIHFPNGERTDICNDQIVMNSVSFKESLCSQNTLKFGLCESSIFQCEVVGVGNVTGAVIEVYCEIFCNSTVEDAIWQPDIEQWVYQIPYGVFTIQTAKRQADMQHRQIVAYTSTSDSFKTISDEEYAKARVPLSSKVTYTPNMVYFSYINGFKYSDDIFTVSNVPYSESYFDGKIWSGPFYIEYEYRRLWIFGRDGDVDYESPDYIYTLKGNTSKLKSFIDKFAENAAKEQPYISEATIRKELTNELGIKGQWRNGLDVYKYFNGIPDQTTNTFFPYINGWYSSSENKHFELIILGGNISVSGYGYTLSENIGFDFTVEKRVVSSAFQNLNLNFTRYYSDVGTSQYQGWLINFNPDEEEAKTYDTLSAQILFDINNAFLEMNGCFGKISRNGAIKITTLQRQFNLKPAINLFPSVNLMPEGVTGGKLLPEDYQSCWYDDYYTKPFGAVQCSYTNTSDQKCVFTLYLSGYNEDSDINSYKVYKFGQDNSLINKRKWTQQQIMDMCNIIVANISGVTYMPVDFVGRGLPYVEAGDTFEVLTKSNDSITTIVLNRIITGEQVLVDSYKSV